MKLSGILNNYNYQKIIDTINSSDDEKIIKILSKDKIDFNDFLLLLSDKAGSHLSAIAEKAKNLTVKRFGKVINFYVPVYLSNVCSNECVYCGFNTSKKVNRLTLNINQIEKEYLKLKEQGFDNVLLLTGEAPNIADLNYIIEAIKLSKKYFTFTGLEIYPMDIDQYKKLIDAGADGLTVYQETYDILTYDKMHLKGKKKDYAWRLNTPERAAIAGFRKIGLGALLGLFDWKYEASMLALHAEYLLKNYWKTEITLGFPRINPPDNNFNIPYPVSDKNFVQLICALRLYLPETGFLLTTRERPQLRDNLIGLCITQISAGSKTNPGGYIDNSSEEQFEVADKRDLNEMIDLVIKKGYEPVLKDWEKSFTGIV